MGKPNAGKSSLLNKLVGQERAIVTEIAGTTRDILEERVSIDGIIFRILDTAGIHSTEDVVEKIGVEKAKSAVEEADLVLYVIDSSIALDDDDKDIFNIIQDKNTLILLNCLSELRKKIFILLPLSYKNQILRRAYQKMEKKKMMISIKTGLSGHL